MAKNQNTFAKRQREMEKKRKAEEKRQRKNERKGREPQAESPVHHKIHPDLPDDDYPPILLDLT